MEGTNQLTIFRKTKPVVVVAKFDRLFSCVADAAQTIVDFDRMSIELVAIAEGFDMTNRYGGLMAQMAVGRVVRPIGYVADWAISPRRQDRHSCPF